MNDASQQSESASGSTSACSKCKLPFIDMDSDCIECERCDGWFCMNCCGLSSTDFRLFQEVRAAHWFCFQCESRAIEAVKTDQVVEERCSKFLGEANDRILRLEKESVKWNEVQDHCNDLDNKLKALTESVSAVQADLSRGLGLATASTTATSRSSHEDLVLSQSDVESICKGCMEEEREKSRRRNNAIFQGIPEAVSDISTARLDHDTGIINDILKQLDMPNTQYEKALRLGKRDPENVKPRPVLIEFKDSKARDMLLRRATNLAKAPDSFKDIYIQPDRTKKEREERRKLVKELKSRQAEGDVRWKIARNKLVLREDSESRRGAGHAGVSDQSFRS